jgi:hypothetical protein
MERKTNAFDFYARLVGIHAIHHKLWADKNHRIGFLMIRLMPICFDLLYRCLLYYKEVLAYKLAHHWFCGADIGEMLVVLTHYYFPKTSLLVYICLYKGLSMHYN